MVFEILYIAISMAWLKLKILILIILLLGEKSCENIFIYEVLYKTLVDAKWLHIMFDKVDGLIRDCDGTKYLLKRKLWCHFW